MEIVTAYKEDRTVYSNFKDLDTAIDALENDGYRVVTRGNGTAIMERPAGESAFAHLLKPEYRAEAVTPASRISIEPSRVSGM